MKRYAIKEIFQSIQGEGFHVGRSMVFIRFCGCNLWDGDPAHREKSGSACALWCDTDFLGGVKMTASEIIEAMPGGSEWCVLTGGEPGLQLDLELLKALHNAGWKVAMETNGTIKNEATDHVDFVTLSPKLGTTYQGKANEVKVVLPGDVPSEMGWTPEQLLALESWSLQFSWSVHLFVQPQDPGNLQSQQYREAVQRCVDWVKLHPQWRLSAQIHKWINVP